MAEILEQNPGEIIGFIISGYIGCVIIIFLLCHCLTNMVNNSKIEKSMKLSTFISLLTALLYCFMAGFIRTNVLIQNLDFVYDGTICNITYGISYVFYTISKFSMYILFTYKIEIVFGSSIYSLSHKLLKNMRYVMIVLCITISVLIFVTKKQQIITSKYSISVCTVNDEINIGNICVILFVVSNLSLCLWLLWLFISKLYKMSKLLTSDIKDIHSNEVKLKSIEQIESQLIKTTILVSISIISTLLFIIIGQFIYRPIRWFMPLDMIINSFSIYLLYAFSRKTYLFCCKSCIICCRLCIKDVDDKIFLDTDTTETDDEGHGEQQGMPLHRKKSSPLEYTHIICDHEDAYSSDNEEQILDETLIEVLRTASIAATAYSSTRRLSASDFERDDQKAIELPQTTMYEHQGEHQSMQANSNDIDDNNKSNDDNSDNDSDDEVLHGEPIMTRNDTKSTKCTKSTKSTNSTAMYSLSLC